MTRLVKTTIALPWTITRRVVGLGAGLLPGRGTADETAPGGRADETVAAAADDALARDREPVEEAIFTPDDDFFDDAEHVEQELELVAESADPEATEPPGAQLHVDEPWEGYRRMKAAEIKAQLDGQPPEVLAAVELYESTHRNRQGVLEAVRSISRG